MALGQAEEDIEVLRRSLNDIDMGNKEFFRVRAKIAILDGLWDLFCYDEVSKVLYRDAINELLLKDIPMDGINYYAGLT